ncbi:hypothetical protein HPP92_010016 [Vanilla planifolia]|uniref:Uncharacterized protein n=1 Tax=Vanilla planifolia TaxID=51239 RepID=A0A835R9P2_VANPL|nr:hypothetical protein HPP92_010016 [Vanilla planifolia]
MAEIMLARLQVTKAFATIVEYRIVPAAVSTRRKLLDLRPSKSTAPKAMNRTEKMVAFAERMTKLLRRWVVRRGGRCRNEEKEAEPCLQRGKFVLFAQWMLWIGKRKVSAKGE